MGPFNVYRWSDMSVDRPMEKIERRRIIGENVMISHVTLARGFVVPVHSHANEQMVVLVSGALKFTLEGERGREERVVRTGEVLHHVKQHRLASRFVEAQPVGKGHHFELTAYALERGGTRVALVTPGAARGAIDQEPFTIARGIGQVLKHIPKDAGSGVVGQGRELLNRRDRIIDLCG